tara:strand:+ start:320 stop:490 length:171 start_codon:yes stop_codon:yes gene_type:complete
MFGLFKDNETINIAINLSAILLKTSSVLQSIPKKNLIKKSLRVLYIEQRISSPFGD